MEESFSPLKEKKILCKFISHLPNSSLLKIYKPTICGFGAPEFHKKCDEKESVLVLIKANGFIFGGFSFIGWNSTRKYFVDENSFLFSFSNPKNKPTFLNVLNQKIVFTATKNFVLLLEVVMIYISPITQIFLP